MTDELNPQVNTEEGVQPEVSSTDAVVEAAPVPNAHGIVATRSPGATRSPRPDSRDSRNGPRNARGKNDRRGPRREPRAKPEFDQKIIDIRRVARVTSGGRRFNFSVTIVAGDRKGKVGVGTGKGGDTALAVDKAFRTARKNLISVNLTPSNSIAHEAMAKYSSAIVEIRPAKGRGIVAGSAVRDVIDLAGIKDIVAKIRSGSKNKLNIAQAAIKALSLVKKPKTPRVKAN